MMCLSAIRKCTLTDRPRGVRAKGPRSTSKPPKTSSSALIALLREGWDTPHAFAALVKLRLSHSARKYLIWETCNPSSINADTRCELSNQKERHLSYVRCACPRRCCRVLIGGLGCLEHQWLEQFVISVHCRFTNSAPRVRIQQRTFGHHYDGGKELAAYQQRKCKCFENSLHNVAP
jgi:hypothetical protein